MNYKINAVRKKIMIAGTRGIPASHGGFETFAEKLSFHLYCHGWDVSVFCQIDSNSSNESTDWQGIKRQLIPVRQHGSVGTIVFDWKSTQRALKEHANIVLVLGYNTAIFSVFYRIRGVPSVMNMDGIEWKRAKWRWWQKLWLFANERIAGLVSSRLIADHPGIRNHLARGFFGRRDIEVIPYGADLIDSADASYIKPYGLMPHEYCIIIARPEPENQVLEIVKAFSLRQRNKKLVVLGKFDSEANSYHAEVTASASEEVLFLGAIYDKVTVSSLRFHATLYLHGHTVGGTNPSLVEALGAGSAIVAHDNEFNRWVAKDGAIYFKSQCECSLIFDYLLDDENKLSELRRNSMINFLDNFQWETILGRYRNLLSSYL